MRNTLDKIGICEQTFITECDASFKQGSKFVNWRRSATPNESDFYYHPFMTPEGYTQANLYKAWQVSGKKHSFADTLNIQSHVCEAALAPKQLTTPNYAGVTNYGYHLDAGKFATLLQKHCTQTLGVRHILDHMVSVNPASNGDISSISTRVSGEISGDLFIDCTGIAALLIGKHYQVPFIEKKHILFNDTAIATQVPYMDNNNTIASATISTAQSNGWIWDIGLPSRRGVGYTYSSAHTSDEFSEERLRAYIAQSTNNETAENVTTRKISFSPGHREKFWQNNCVAVGMSAGFLEPLEASALALIELSCAMISEELPSNRQHMDIIAKRFNDRFTYRWDRVIEFLKLHYILSERNDSDYWLENKNECSIPERLQELMTLWQFQSPSRLDFIQNEEVFPSASYQYVLYGMGFETDIRDYDAQSDKIELAFKYFNENHAKINSYLSGLPTNRELIEHIRNTKNNN